MGDSGSWRQHFLLRQQCVVVADLARAGVFLRSMQTSGGGWPIHRGLGPDLHATALAVESLAQFNDDASRVSSANGAIFLMRWQRNRLDELNLDQLADLLNAANAEQQPDSEYVNSILRAIHKRFGKIGKGEAEFAVPSVSAALWSNARTKGRTDLPEGIIEGLEGLQSRDDGSWPVLAEGPTSLVATCGALRALSVAGRNRERIQRGTDFLLNAVKKAPWDSLGKEDDLFTHAILLRTLAEMPAVSYELVASGVSALVKVQNGDGGWGGALSEPSTVENTALNMMALIAAGEAQFLPVRLAVAAMEQAEQILTVATAERDKLKEGFDRELEVRSGQLVRELKDLRKQNEELRAKNEQLRTKNDELRISNEESRAKIAEMRVRLDRSFSGLSPETLDVTKVVVDQQRSRRFLIISTAVMLIVSTAALATSGNMKWIGWALLSAAIAMSILVLSDYFARRYRRLNKSLERVLQERFEVSRAGTRYDIPDEPLGVSSRRFVEPFLRINARIPPSVREELLYRLFSDFPEMPPEIVPRYARDLVLRLSLPPDEGYPLMEWLERMSTLPPGERRVLLDSITRAIRR